MARQAKHAKYKTEAAMSKRDFDDAIAILERLFFLCDENSRGERKIGHAVDYLCRCQKTR